MDKLVKLEFNPGAATVYFNTAEKGISILVVQPWHGNETSNVWSKEQTMQLMERNYMLSNVLGLTKKDPCHLKAPTLNSYETSGRFVHWCRLCLETNAIISKTCSIYWPC